MEISQNNDSGELMQEIIDFSRNAVECMNGNTSIICKKSTKIADKLDEIHINSLNSTDFFIQSEQASNKSKDKNASKLTWDENKNNILKQLRITYKRDWRKILQKFVNLTGERGATIKFLKEKYDSTRTHKKVDKKVLAYTEEEDNKLLEAVQAHGFDWKLIEEKIPGKKWESLKNRYYYIQRKQHST